MIETLIGSTEIATDEQRAVAVAFCVSATFLTFTLCVGLGIGLKRLAVWIWKGGQQ